MYEYIYRYISNRTKELSLYFVVVVMFVRSTDVKTWHDRGSTDGHKTTLVRASTTTYIPPPQQTNIYTSYNGSMKR